MLVQPESRKSPDGTLKSVEKVAKKEWEDLKKMAGRNGVLLYFAGLLWWGEATAREPEAEILLGEWRVAVEEVRSVLEGAMKGSAKAK